MGERQSSIQNMNDLVRALVTRMDGIDTRLTRLSTFLTAATDTLADDVLAAAEAVEEALEPLLFHMRRKNSDQTVADSTNEDYDYGALVLRNDNGIIHRENLGFTIGSKGLYLITAQVNWDIDTNGYRALILQKNGATISVDRQDAPTAAAGRNNLSVQHILEPDDFIQFIVHQTSGGPLDANASQSLVCITRLLSLETEPESE